MPAALIAAAVLGLNTAGITAEIIYQDDVVQNVVTNDVWVRTADNVIVLVDASSSMDFSRRKFKKTNYELEKQALGTRSTPVWMDPCADLRFRFEVKVFDQQHG